MGILEIECLLLICKYLEVMPQCEETPGIWTKKTAEHRCLHWRLSLFTLLCSSRSLYIYIYMVRTVMECSQGVRCSQGLSKVRVTPLLKRTSLANQKRCVRCFNEVQSYVSLFTYLLSTRALFLCLRSMVPRLSRVSEALLQTENASTPGLSFWEGKGIPVRNWPWIKRCTTHFSLF